MSSNKDEEKKEFTIEEQNDAYLELCYYIRTAIENGDFASLEPLIALWESKYPLDKFTDPEIIRKIKAILNKDYLSRLVGDYLASKVLHEQQKQKEFYDKLNSIITTAEKSKDYKTAKKEITAWKNDLHSYGFSIYDFNKRDLKNILDWISLPAQKLREHSAASKSLNELLNNSNKLDSKQLSEEIENWKGKHPLDSYSNKSRKDMEEILKSLEKLVSQKDTEESAIQKMQDYLSLSSEEKQSPAEEIPKLLAEFNFSDFSDEAKSKISDLSCEAMSLYSLNCVKDEPEITIESPNIILAYQQDALNELREIIKKDKNNYSDLFNWIYLYRKTAFSPEAIEEIKKSFIEDAGFDIPKKGKYSIPSFNTNNKDLTNKDINTMRKKVVLSYLGILYMDGDHTLSNAEKDTISEIADTPVIQVTNRGNERVWIIPVEDNFEEAPQENTNVQNEQLAFVPTLSLKNQKALEKDNYLINNSYIKSLPERSMPALITKQPLLQLE